MHPVVERLRIALVFTMVLFAGGNVLVGRVLAAEPAPSARWCVAAAYRQFDFWVGDWDVFDVGSSDSRWLRFTGRLPGNRRTQRPKFHNLRCCQESLASELGDQSRRTLGDSRGKSRMARLF